MTDQLMTVKEVAATLHLGKSTVFKMIADGTFPPGIRLGPQAVRWRTSTVEEWLSRQPDSR